MFQTVPFKWSHFQAVPQFEDIKVLFKETKRKIMGKGEDLTNGVIYTFYSSLPLIFVVNAAIYSVSSNKVIFHADQTLQKH